MLCYLLMSSDFPRQIPDTHGFHGVDLESRTNTTVRSQNSTVCTKPLAIFSARDCVVPLLLLFNFCDFISWSIYLWMLRWGGERGSCACCVHVWAGERVLLCVWAGERGSWCVSEQVSECCCVSEQGFLSGMCMTSLLRTLRIPQSKFL